MVPGRGPARDDRRHLADRGLHRLARGRVRRLQVRRAPVLDQGVPREGPDLPGSALDDGPLREQGHGRDPRADGLHGRLPDDDRLRHLHHQRHRARHRHAARALPGRLPDGAEGPDEAGLHGQPDAEPRLLARARDRQEGRRLRPHRPQAQAADHDAPPRPPGRGPVDRLRARHLDERGDPRPVRQLVVHRQHPREGPLHAGGGGPDRGVQEAAPRRAADARQRAQPAAGPLLRPQALRPDQGRPLQAQPAARRHRAGRRPRPHDRGHRRARPQADRAAGQARRARGLQGLRRRRDLAAARADRSRARRVRALRQPPAAHRRRADPGGVPRRPLPHGARRARADDDRGRRHDHAADDHQHPPGRGRAEGVLRLLAAVAVHGPDELARRPHPPPPPLGARRGRPHARARADRGARRPPDPLRAHVPDRDAGRPEHRPDRLPRLLRDGLGVRLRPDAVPEGRRAARSPTRSSTSTPSRSRATRSRRRPPTPTRTASCSATRCSAAPRRARPSRRRRRRSSSWTSRRRRSCPSRRR